MVAAMILMHHSIHLHQGNISCGSKGVTPCSTLDEIDATISSCLLQLNNVAAMIRLQIEMVAAISSGVHGMGCHSTGITRDVTLI